MGGLPAADDRLGAGSPQRQMPDVQAHDMEKRFSGTLLLQPYF